MLFCNRNIIFDHFCYRYFSACMLQNAYFIFINIKSCSKIWLCLRNQKALQENGIALSNLNIEMNLGTTEGIKHFVEHSQCMGIISVRAIYKSIYEQVFKVLEVENLKMEREFLFVEKRGETAKLQQTFKRFITQGYNA